MKLKTILNLINNSKLKKLQQREHTDGIEKTS